MRRTNLPIYKFRYKIAHLLTLLAPKIVKLTLLKEKWRYTLQDYRNFPVGTVAREIANYLDLKGLCFLPKGEKHDVRHIVLGYEMNVEGEVRMQAFLIGNGKLHLYGILYLGFFLILLPELIIPCLGDFLRGRQAVEMADLSEVALLGMHLDEVKKLFAIKETLEVKVQLY